FGDREARAGNRRFVARALGDLSIHSCSLPAPDFTGAGRKSKSPFRGLGSRGLRRSLGVEPLGGKLGAFRERLELGPGDLRVDAAAQSAIGRGDHILGPYRLGET